MQKETIVAISVDVNYVVLYKPDGTTLSLLQGDARIPRIIDQAKPSLEKVPPEPVEVDLSPVVHVNTEYQHCQEKTGIKFFRLAKKFLKELMGNETPEQEIEVAHIKPMDIGRFPGTVVEEVPDSAPKSVPETTVVKTNEDKVAEAHAKLYLIEGKGVTPDQPEFHTPLDEEQETIVAVHDGQVIPDAQKLQRQLKAASKLQDFTGFQKFMERLAPIVSKRGHTIEELMKFMEKGDLPIADDGCIVIYKRLRSETKDIFVDCHTRKVKQKVGSFVFMHESLVDASRRRDCSTGLHVGSLGYMGNFPGDITVIGKVRPEDVIAVPEYQITKMRVCGYHIVALMTDAQHNAINQGKSICTAVGGTELLNKVLRGDHIGITQHVEIKGSHGTNVTITDLKVEHKTTDVTVKEIQNTTIDLEENLNESPKSEPVKATDLKPAMETKAQKAKRLYQDYKTTGDVSVAVELVTLKKASKSSWYKIGLDDSIGKLLLEAVEAGKSDKPVAEKVTDFAPIDTKPKAGDRLAKVQNLLKDFKHSPESVQGMSAANALLNLKRQAKVSWEKLGVSQADADAILKAVELSKAP